MLSMSPSFKLVNGSLTNTEQANLLGKVSTGSKNDLLFN